MTGQPSFVGLPLLIELLLPVFLINTIRIPAAELHHVLHIGITSRGARGPPCPPTSHVRRPIRGRMEKIIQPPRAAQGGVNARI
jgi:hypothetical protein